MKKVADNKAVDDYFVNLCKFALEKGDEARCYGVLERILGHCGNTRIEIAQMYAEALKKAGYYTKAYKFFFRGKDEDAII